MSDLNPTSQIASQVATTREARHAQQVNAVLYRLERSLKDWRLMYAASRSDVVRAIPSALFDSAVERLAELGEH